MKCKFCKPFVLIFMQNDGGWGGHTPSDCSPLEGIDFPFSIFDFLFSILHFRFSFEDQRGFFLAVSGPPFSSRALIAFTNAAPLARNSPIRSPATCSGSFSPRGSSATRTRLRSSRLRLLRA